MPPQAQRAIDLYELCYVGTTVDQRECQDRLQGLLKRMTKEELAGYYGELMRRRAAEKAEGEDA